MRARLARAMHPAVLAVAFALLAAWSWRKWADVQIDFGAQLYIPWRLAEGQALYLDIEYKDGPFSQYLNALLFRLFGVSLSTLIWANLTFLASLCTLVWVMAARACDRSTATIVVLVQLCVFSFSQYTVIGNYNYVCPYTHEQTHGMLLAVAMIFAFATHARGGFRMRWMVVAGAALGCLFLTKAELFIPAVATTALAVMLLALAHPQRRAWALAAASCLAAAVLVPAAALALLATQMPFDRALGGVLGNWRHLGVGVLDYKIYRLGMGLDDPVGNIVWASRLFLGLCAGITGVGVASWVVRRLDRHARDAIAVVAGVVVLIVLVVLPVSWSNVGRPLPLTSATLLGVLVFLFVTRWRDPLAMDRFFVPALWATFSLLLLGKVLLNVTIPHYGFVLALPATLLLVAALTWAVPATFESRLGNGALARCVLVAVVLAGVVHFLQWSNRNYALKNLPVGDGGDVLMAGAVEYDARGWAFARVAAALRTHMGRDATLLAMPEGVMLNYWLRRPNPTRHVYFSLWTLATPSGEQEVLDDIRTHPPSVIAITHRDASEFGFDYFGRDPRFGRRIMTWVREHYRPVGLIGAEPLRDGRFGILLLERGTP